MPIKATFLRLRDNQLEMDESAFQHTSDTKGDDEAEYGKLIADGLVIIHMERFVNTLKGCTRACDGTCTCTYVCTYMCTYVCACTYV